MGEGAEEEDDVPGENLAPTYKRDQSFTNPNYGSTNSINGKPKIAFAEEVKENGGMKNGTIEQGMNGYVNKGMDQSHYGATNADAVLPMDILDQNKFISKSNLQYKII